MTQASQTPTVGNIVFHAHHGALRIDAVADGVVTLEATSGEELVVRVPVDRLDPTRFRPPVDVDDVAEVIAIAMSPGRYQTDNFARRLKRTESRFAANDVWLTAEIVRDLRCRPKLSTAERRSLLKAVDQLNLEIEAVTGEHGALDAALPVAS